MSMRFGVGRQYRLVAVLISALALWTATTVVGADRMWDGGGDGVSWYDDQNWSPDGSPGIGEALGIKGTGPSDGADVLVDGGSIGASVATMTLGSLELGDVSTIESTLVLTHGTQLHLTGPISSTLLSVGGYGVVGSPATTVDTGGRMEIENGSHLINEGKTAIGAALDEWGIAVVTGQDTVWDNYGDLIVGLSGPGELTISDEATVNSHETRLTTGQRTTVQATVTVTDPGTTWNIDGSFHIGTSRQATLSITDGATVESGTVYLGNRIDPIGTGFVTVRDATWRVDGSVNQYRGLVWVADNGLLDVSGYVEVRGGLNIDGGTVEADYIERTDDAGVLLEANSTLRLRNPTTPVAIGREGLFGAVQDLSTRCLDLAGPLHIHADGVLTGASNSTLAAGSILNDGRIELGGNATLANYRGDGVLSVSNYEATLTGAGFVELGAATTLAGGRIYSATGIALDSGDVLSGYGQVDAAVAAGIGSVIEAGGTLTLGDSSVRDGFFSDGRLIVGSHHVTLEDRDQAVLGSLTELGAGASPGMVSAAGGALVEFGKSVVGYGTLATPDNPATPLIVNGFVGGNSAAQPITLTGYVKGVGTFGHVEILGTLSPGFSPATVEMANVVLADTATLIMELGGTTPGSGHDVLNVSDHIELAGTLDVDLINGFEPSPGDVFDLFNFADSDGEFDTVLLPDLEAGLSWDATGLYTEGVLLVLAELIPGDLNGDGMVGSLDLDIVRAHWEETVDPGCLLCGDPSGDGIVGSADLDIVRANWGAGMAAASVPEPSILWLVIAGVAFTTFRRNRWRTA